MRTHSLADLPGALHDLADWLESRTKRLDRFFWHTVRMARFGPDIHFATNREVEEPYRTGKVVILHLEPFRTGIALGWYARPVIDAYDDNAVSEHVRRAVTVREPSQKELEAYDDDVLHGPGKPAGLRFSATGGSPARGGRPGPGMVAADDDGPEL